MTKPVRLSVTAAAFLGAMTVAGTAFAACAGHQTVSSDTIQTAMTTQTATQTPVATPDAKK